MTGSIIESYPKRGMFLRRLTGHPDRAVRVVDPQHRVRSSPRGPSLAGFPASVPRHGRWFLSGATPDDGDLHPTGVSGRTSLQDSGGCRIMRWQRVIPACSGNGGKTGCIIDVLVPVRPNIESNLEATALEVAAISATLTTYIDGEGIEDPLYHSENPFLSIPGGLA